MRRKNSSLPSRERGLKLDASVEYIQREGVAPLAGAWIEIRTNQNNTISYIVAPLAGAWIEIPSWKTKETGQ